MNTIINAALDRSRTVLLTLVLILVSGVVAYVNIPKESDPDIDIPIIYVSMSHEGISPEDAERLLVRPMEKELRAIEGVKEMRSTAAEGHASVLLEFEAGFDADQAFNDVSEKVDIAKNELPGDTEEPTVNEVNVGLFPVLIVTLSGEVPERTMFKLARDLRDELEGLPGVLEAEIAGDRDEVLEVIVDPLRMESYNISHGELVRAMTMNNRLVAAGALDTGQGRFSVKVPGLFQTAKDVLEVPIKVNGDGVVTLADITSVRRTFKDATTYARLNGKPAVVLEIKKRLGENVIVTIDDVRRIVAQESANWPPGVEVAFSQDKADEIRMMLNELQNNVISAIILVMVVVVGALGLRSAGLVGLAIPSSFLFGILVLSMLGLTMNMVVLFSLILAVGMLVDGAIVVTEFADRKMAEGVHRRDAYALAAKRMAWPITASTATTLAAFMPLLFWPGVVGEFMLFLPITLMATLSGSLLMALVFVPTLGAYVGKPGSANPEIRAALAGSESGSLDQVPGLTGTYVRTLQVLLRHPLKVVALAVALLVGTQAYYANRGNGIEFFPDVEPNQAVIMIHARGNMSIDERDALVREVEAEVLQVPGIETAYARVGTSSQGSNMAEDVIGTIQLELEDWDTRQPAAQIMDEIRRRTKGLAGIGVEVRKPVVGPPTGKPIQLHLSSRYPEAIEPVLVEVLAGVRRIEGLIDIEDSRAVPGVEWQLEVDRAQAGRFSADIATVGNMVKLVTNGIKVDEYRPDDSDEEVEIRVRYPLDERNINQLDQLRIRTPDGLVPISNFVTRSPKAKTGTVKRTDGRRIMTIKAGVAEGVLPDNKMREVRAWLAGQELDPRVEIAFKGEDEEQKKAEAFLKKAFGVALFVMAIILVTQFNSFYHAFLILTAVIMSTIGVMLGLIVTGQPFGIVMTGVGVITLAGIVVNNNIVLIDTYDRLKKSGMPALEAVVRTGAQRLRPVMLTAVTTVLGLMPMVLQVNIDMFSREISMGAPSTQWWVQLATAVVAGLSFATVLTLVVTPCLLVIGANTSKRLEDRRARRAARAIAGAQAAG
ncbi:MAG: efflux RND transporter permease subunit [Alphaproteobacteria bacterium]|nr:efflux RND transporter permease subunit [Alphaproteobacteria bacterium]